MSKERNHPAISDRFDAMNMPLLLRLALTMTTTLVAAGPQDWREDRAKTATRAIFRVLAGSREHPQKCEYDVGWDRYPVPGGLAREVLGLTLDVDILASEEPLSIQDVVDPSKTSSEAFCSEKDHASYLEQRASTREKMPLHRTRLTFPVFDKAQRVAIVVLTRVEEGGLYVMADGKTLHRPTELSIIAFVLKDAHGKWQVVRSETLAIT